MIFYKLAEIGFCFETPGFVAESENYGKFRVDSEIFADTDEKYTFTFGGTVNKLPEFQKKVFECSDYSVYQCENGYARVLSRFDKQSYNCICTQSPYEPRGEIIFTANGAQAQRTSAELFRMTDLFSALLYYDAFILHGSVAQLDGKAYVFSGDSGVGKSTQAELWRIVHGAAVLNGDRVIIRKIKGEWRAFGLPMCGSSRICEAFDLPLEAITFLSQGRKNEASVPALFHKVIQIMAQASISMGKKEDSEKLLTLAEDIGKNIKILKYTCTADDEAAVFLKNYLNDYEKYS